MKSTDSTAKIWRMAIWPDFGFRENPYAVEPLGASKEGRHLLIGRESELTRLTQALVSLDLHPTVEGPIGSGKTSLISVARHLVDTNRSDSARFFDSEITIQITEAMTIESLERRVSFEIAQFFIRREGDLKSVGLSVPDTSLVDRWLNIPVYRGGQAGAAGFQAGVSQQATQSPGFDEAGFRAQVLDWLSECFPTHGTGGLICTLDNLELLESSSLARRTLEQLRDGPLSWPGLRWILAGSAGVLRSATMSPRLSGHLAHPIRVARLQGADVPEVIRARIEEFGIDAEPYTPVGPVDFPMVFEAVNGNLRAALQLCQELALEVYEAAFYASPDSKGEFISRFLESKAEEYLRDAASLPDECWELLDLLAAGGGMCALQEHSHYGFRSADELTKLLRPMEATNIVTRVVIFGPNEEPGFELTSAGWLTARARLDSRVGLETLRELTEEKKRKRGVERKDSPVPPTQWESRQRIGYRAPQVCHIVGITYRQLDYWARTGLVTPSVRDVHSTGSQRMYSFSDVVQLKVIKNLLDAGMSLKKIRTAVEVLREAIDSDQPLADVTLLSDGQTFYAAHSHEGVAEILRKAKGGVLGIALGPTQDQVVQAIHQLFVEGEEEE